MSDLPRTDAVMLKGYLVELSEQMADIQTNLDKLKDRIDQQSETIVYLVAITSRMLNYEPGSKDEKIQQQLEKLLSLSARADELMAEQNQQ